MSVKVISGRRTTKQRQLVLETLKNNTVHPTAEFIYNKLKAEYPEISLGTVYRNLSVLHEQGEISIVPGNFQRDHFDANASPHYHFVCNICESIFDMDMPYKKDLDCEAKTNDAFEIESHHTIFFGHCRNCKEQI